MKGLLQRVLRGGRSVPVDYDVSKRLAVSADPADRRSLAGRTGAQPEVLYYLACDPDPSVRVAVAGNEAAPVQADLMLARDSDEAVRQDLAHKIARLAPGLSAGETDRLRQLTYQALEQLVQDQAVKVRRILAEALKDTADIAPEIIARLARDCETVVATPVLQCSPVLTDEDLLDILHTLPSPGAAVAIAGRTNLGGRVADAIGRGIDEEAIGVLLSNPSAQIREETLDLLVARAPGILAWHRPLVSRPGLSSLAILKLARFVAANLLDRLKERRDLDPATMRAVSKLVMERLDAEGKAGPAPPGADDAPDPDQIALSEVRRLALAGVLDETQVLDRLAESDRRFVRAALVERAGVSFAVVDKVLAAQSPKGVTALAWKAGFGMRAAVKLQIALARIPSASVLKPLADDRFPLTPEALAWQLDFFAQMAVEGAERV